MRGRVILAIVTAALALTGQPARAVDFHHDAVRFILQSNPSTGRARFIARSKFPAPVLPTADPAVVGGSLQIINPISGESATFDLPAEGWSANTSGTTLRFRNPDAPGGLSEVKIVAIKGGKELKMAARATGITLDEPTQGSIAVILAIGSDRYCVTCGSPRRDEPNKFIARRCPPPPGCALPPPPTTTSTSSSTSTSTTSSSTSSTSTSSTTTTSTSSTVSTTTSTSSTTTTSTSSTSTTSTSTTIVTTTSTSSTTTTSTSTTTTTTLACVCGDAFTNSAAGCGETCDDGNTNNNDACPSDCKVDPCTETATAVDTTVTYQIPVGTGVAAIQVLVDYPEGKVSIPGLGSGIPAGTVTDTPAGSSASHNDLNHALRETIASASNFPASTTLFRVHYVACQGAPAPTAGEFTCTVLSAEDQDANVVSPVTCSVTIP